MKKSAGKKYVPMRMRQRKTRRRKLLLTMLISCVVISLAIVVLQMDCWKIKIIEVKGTARVSPENVYRDAGVNVGDHMLFVSRGAARRRLIAIPLVKDVEIAWRLPNRMIISVTERKPFAYLVYGGKYFMVDRESVLLEAPAPRPTSSLLLVRTDKLNTRVEIGSPVRFPHVKRFFEVCDAMEANTGGWAKEIVFSVGGVKIFLKKGLYVLLGEGDMAAQKLSLIPLLLESKEKIKGEILGIDLRYLDSPSFIMKKTSVVEK